MENNAFKTIQELLQQKEDYQICLSLLSYDGTPEIKELNDGRYLYVRKRVASRLISEYVGVCTDNLYQLLLRNAREARELRKQIRHVEKKLTELGFLEAELSPLVLLNLDFARANMKASIYREGPVHKK